VAEPSRHEPQTRFKDGRAWVLGGNDEVAWINACVNPGLSITAAIPPTFSGYATLADPGALDLEHHSDDLRQAEDRFDDAVLSVLATHTEPQPWWLGFLETGASDVVFDDAPRVRVYGCRYVLVQAGPREARTWRSDWGRWHTALPDLMFPIDRSWLLSSLWDDAWACVGGPIELISALLADPELRAGAQQTDPSIADMWPPGLPEELHTRLKR
jgi:hypothetical protein